MPNDKIATAPALSGAQRYLLPRVILRLGRLVVVDGEARVIGGPGSSRPTPARWLESVERDALVREGRERELLLVFEDDCPDQAIVIGVLADPSAARRRRELDAQDELVLRCGESSLTLRRNGRVVISGKQVETRADGRVRLTGATVEIN